MAGGENVDLGGIVSASCGGPWAGVNLGFVSQPVRSGYRFRPRIERALEHFRARGWPWLLVVPDRWVAPGLQGEIVDILTEFHFQLAMNSTVVTADRLRDPDESPLQIRRAADAQDWKAIAVVNAESWSVPEKWVRPLLDSTDFQSHVRGWIGWLDEQAVCAAVTFPTLEYTYYAWAATIPAYRKHGFGSRLLRYAAAQAGTERPLFAVLGPYGLRTYQDAGFQPREYFRLYLAPTT